MGKGPEGMEKALLKIEELKKSKASHEAAVEKLTKAGVYFVDPDRVILTEETEIGRNSVVYPNVIFEGRVKIGRGTSFIPEPGSKIRRSAISMNLRRQWSRRPSWAVIPLMVPLPISGRIQ